MPLLSAASKDNEEDDMEFTQHRISFLQALNLILPLSMVPIKDVRIDEDDRLKNMKSHHQIDKVVKHPSFNQGTEQDQTEPEKRRLRGYETLQELRDKASSYRQDYLNWRKFKPKGAKGEASDLFTRRKPSECSIKFEASLLKQQASLNREPQTESGQSSPQTPSFFPAPSVQHVIEPPLEAITKKTAKDEEAWLRFYYNPFTPAGISPQETHIRESTLSNFVLRGVKIPTYSRIKENITHWIMHLGVGQFHRSHQLVFMDDLLSKQNEQKWGYCGVGLMPFDLKMANALRNQDYLYTVMTRTNTTCSVRIIGSMFDYVFAYDEFTDARLKLLNPNLHIISLTITEKGYCQNVSGDLDTHHPLVIHDLKLFQNDSQDLQQSPRTAVGFIYWGLLERYRHHLPPFTVMSCDNLPENGHVAKRMVIAFAKCLDPEFSVWIDQNIKFPCTMVDRITPATVPEHREILCKDYGLIDEWPVVTEEFMQWAIEDNFTVRPAWEQVGALLVSDVRPLELMKLRLLNGGHCVIGYISYLAGYHFVDDAVNDVKISSFLRAYMDEMTSTIRNVSIELERYKEKIVERFGNRMIKDRLLRLCEDGSTKIYNTMKDALIELLSEKRDIHCTALGLAAFILFLTLAPPEVILDAKKDQLIVLAKNAVQQLPHTDNVSIFLLHIFGNFIAKDPCIINHVSLALFALQNCTVKRVLHCGGIFETLFDAQLRSPILFQSLMQFVAISQ